MRFLKICLFSFLFADGLEESKHRPRLLTEEVNARGRISHHELERKISRSKVKQKNPGPPVTFFQEELEQGPLHKTNEMRVKESGEAAEFPSEHHELVKLSDKPTEQDGLEEELPDPNDAEETDEDQTMAQSEADSVESGEDEDSDGSDGFTLPRGDEKEELQGHSDDASVAELSPSIMRREVSKTVQHQLAMEMVAKKWFDLDTHNGKVLPHHRWRKAILVFSLLGVAVTFMLLAVVKADNVIKSVLPGSSRSTEPSGSELQEPERKEVAEKSADSKDSFKSLASLVEGSLGQCVIRKPNKEDKDSDADMISGRLRSRIQALPVSAASQVEKMLPSAGGYDVNFSKPMSSRWLLRLEAVIQEPQDGEALLSPLTQRSCVLYTAHASRKVHGGMPLPVAFASQHMDFMVTLCGTDSRVDIRVAGSEVNLFSTSECEFAEVLPFPCAPDHWQDFVSVHLSGGTGSSDNHALENELRDKGTAVEFHECCLATGATVTLVGELLRSATGELTLQPLSQEQVSWKRTSWEKTGLAEAGDLELLEARTHVLISDDPTLLGCCLERTER